VFKDFVGQDVWGGYIERNSTGATGISSSSSIKNVPTTTIQNEMVFDHDSVMSDCMPLHTLLQSNILPLYRAVSSSDTDVGPAVGYRRLVELADCLNVFSTRSELQMAAQQKFTCCALPHIFGAAFDSQRIRLMEEYKTKSIKTGTIMYLPRRHGKSVATAEFVAGYAVSQCKYDSFTIELIAHGIKQTGMLMGLVKTYLDNIYAKFGNFGYKRNNAFELWIYRNNNVVKIRCWTDSLSHTLGMGSKGLVILDEAVQMPTKFFLKNIKPILQMAYTSLAIISSPGPPNNWVTMLMNVKDEKNEPVIDVLNEVKCCAKCMQLPFDKRIDCTHVRPPPFWLSSAKQAVNAIIAKKFNAIGTHMQEEMGMVGASCDSPSFVDTLLLEKVFKCPFIPYNRETDPDVVYVAIDPGGGKSRTAVITGYRDGTNLAVCIYSYIYIYLSIVAVLEMTVSVVKECWK
jgi:hypothetical protein